MRLYLEKYEPPSGDLTKHQFEAPDRPFRALFLGFAWRFETFRADFVHISPFFSSFLMRIGVPEVVKPLAAIALELSKLPSFTKRDAPTVIT